MKQIIFIGNDKGGVGKTTVCAALVEFLLAYNLPFILFDADRSNPDIRGAYKELAGCRLALFSEADRFQDSPNNLYLAAQDNTVVVNLPAQVSAPLFEWFQENEILDIAAEDDIQFHFFHVTDGQYESLNILLQYLEFFQQRVGHIIVKNWGKTENWKALESHSQLQEYIHQYQIPVLDFPKFHGIKEMEIIRQNRMSFTEAANLPDFNAISRRRVTRFLRETKQCFTPIHFLLFNDEKKHLSQKPVA